MRRGLQLAWCLWSVVALPAQPAQPAQPARPPQPVPSPVVAPAQPDKPDKPAQRKAVIRALEPNTVVKTGKDRSVTARGKLQLVLPDDDVIAFCDAVDYSGETTGVATLQGHLRMLSGKITEKDGNSVIDKPENEVTGVIGWIFTKEKRAVVDGDVEPKVEGKVVVIHTPKDAAPADVDRFEKTKYQPTTMHCDRVTFWYRKGDRKALCQAKLPNVNITFEQQDQHGSAGRATYFEVPKEVGDSGDVLDLEGGVKVANKDGESIEAGAARIFIDQETSQWFEVTRVVVNVGEEEGKTPNKPPAQPGTVEPTPGGPPAPPSSPPEPTKPPDTPSTR